MARIEAEERKLQELITKLEAAIYQLTLLHSRFEQGKDKMLQKSGEIKEVAQTLGSELEDFAALRGEIGRILVQRMEQGTNIMARVADESIREEINSKVGEATERLVHAANLAVKKLSFFYDLDLRRIMYMALGLVVFPIVTALLIAKLLMPAPTVLRIDKRLCEKLCDTYVQTPQSRKLR